MMSDPHPGIGDTWRRELDGKVAEILHIRHGAGRNSIPIVVFRMIYLPGRSYECPMDEFKDLYDLTESKAVLETTNP